MEPRRPTAFRITAAAFAGLVALAGCSTGENDAHGLPVADGLEVPELAADHPLAAQMTVAGYHNGELLLPVSGGGMVGDKREFAFRTEDGGKLFVRGVWDEETQTYAEPPTVSIEIPEAMFEPGQLVGRFDARDGECEVTFLDSPAPDATDDELAGVVSCLLLSGEHRTLLDAVATFRWRPDA